MFVLLWLQEAEWCASRLHRHNAIQQLTCFAVDRVCHTRALCICCLQEAEGGALAGFTGTMRYSSGLIADQKRTAAALVRVSKMMGKVRLDGYRGCADGLNPRLLVKFTPCLHNKIRKHAMLSTEPQEKDSRCGMYHTKLCQRLRRHFV